MFAARLPVSYVQGVGRLGGQLQPREKPPFSLFLTKSAVACRVFQRAGGRGCRRGYFGAGGSAWQGAFRVAFLVGVLYNKQNAAKRREGFLDLCKKELEG